MSESTRLGVSITATDTASASIAQLQNTVRGLQRTLADVGGTAADAGGKITNAINAEIAAINREIIARGGQAAAIKGVTTAIKEQTTAAEVLHRTLQQNIDQSFGANADRGIKSASDSARVLATSLSAAAEADARLRNEALATAAALEKQGLAVRSLTGAQFFGAMDRRMGIGQPKLSAESSAGVFQRELGPAGLGITSVETKATIDTLQGINRELISAKASAAVFAQELGSIGGAVRTIPTASFNRMVADLAGVKQSYLSAAESAAVFARAGLTATEAGLGMTTASVAAAAATERMSASAARGIGGAALGQEARHVVAAFDEISRGQTGQLFSTMGAAARDAGIGIGAMSASLGGLVAIMGAIHIARQAEELGKWATELRASAAASGMSVQAYAGLQAALTHMGLKGQEADASLRHLGETLSTALSQPMSKAAEAFHNLGISQAQLQQNGDNVAGALRLIADAFTRTQDGGNKTANMAELLGQHFSKLIPLLEGGSSGLDQLIQKMRETGRVIDEDGAKKLEALGQKVREVSEAISSGAVPAFVAWAPVIAQVAETIAGMVRVISGAITAIGQLVTAMNSIPKMPDIGIPGISPGIPGVSFGGAMRGASAIAGAAPGAMNWIKESIFGKAPPTPVSEFATSVPRTTPAKEAVPPLTAPVSVLDKMHHDMSIAAEAASRNINNAKAARIAADSAEIASMRQVLLTAQMTNKERETVEKELADKQRALHMANISGGGGRANQATMDFVAAERLKIAEANGSATKIAAIYDEMLSQLGTKYKASAAQIANIEREKVNAVNAARLAEIREDTRKEEQNNRLLRLNTQLSSMAAGTFKFAGQQSQGPGADIARSQTSLQEAEQVRASSEARLAELAVVRNSSEEGTRIRKEAEQEILSVTLQAKSQEVALYKEAGDAAVMAANKIAAPFTTAFDAIGSQAEQFSSSLITALISPQKDMIKAGLTTKVVSEQGNEIRAAARTMFLGIVNDLAKSLETGLSHAIASAISGGTSNTIGDLLGKLFTKALTSLTGNAAGGAVTNVGASAATTVGGTAVKAGASTAGTAATSMTPEAISGPIVAATTASSASNVAVTTAGAATQAGATATTGATQIVATTTSGAIQAGATTAGAATQVTATTGAAAATTVSFGVTSAAQTAAITGAIAASTATEVVAIDVGHPSALGFSLAGGGIIPSAAGGMKVGGNGSLAILHAKEMVLPAPISEGIQSMIARGGTGGNNTSNNANMNYSPTVNMAPRGRGGTGMTRAEFGQMMSSHGGAMMGETRNMMRSGWRPS